MVWNSYQYILFFVFWTWNRVYDWLRWFLDEDDIEVALGFKYCVDNKVVLENILQKYLNVFHNYTLLPFMTEQIDFFLML